MCETPAVNRNHLWNVILPPCDLHVSRKYELPQVPQDCFSCTERSPASLWEYFLMKNKNERHFTWSRLHGQCKMCCHNSLHSSRKVSNAVLNLAAFDLLPFSQKTQWGPQMLGDEVCLSVRSSSSQRGWKSGLCTVYSSTLTSGLVRNCQIS